MKKGSSSAVLLGCDDVAVIRKRLLYRQCFASSFLAVVTTHFTIFWIISSLYEIEKVRGLENKSRRKTLEATVIFSSVSQSIVIVSASGADEIVKERGYRNNRICKRKIFAMPNSLLFGTVYIQQ